MMDKTLGVNIKQLRYENGLTQAQLAELADITIAYLSKIENQKVHNVSLSISYRLAMAVGVSGGLLICKLDTDRILDAEIQSHLAKCSLEEKRKILQIVDILIGN